MSVSSVPVEALFKIDSAIPCAPAGPRSPIQNIEYGSKETHPTMLETTIQESPASPVGGASKGVAITGSPAGEATLSPRSMLARARASPPRKSLIMEELLALPEEKPTASVAKTTLAANDAVPVHVEEGPTTPQSAFNFLPKSQLGKSKVLPRPLTIRRPQACNAWRRPSAILQNSLELIGCEDSLVDEFDDLAVFVDIRRNVFENAWMNVIAAIAIAGRIQDMDEEVWGSPIGEDAVAMVGCGSMDDPVVAFVPRADGGIEEMQRSKLTSEGTLAEANPFNLSPSAHSASPRLEAPTVARL